MMKRTLRWLFALMISMCFVLAIPAPASALTGGGKPDHPYWISSINDWNSFVTQVERGRSAGIYYALYRDIEVSAPVGTAEHPFEGVFDGCGHTITFKYNTSENQDSSGNDDGAAPFRYISGGDDPERERFRVGYHKRE